MAREPKLRCPWCARALPQDRLQWHARTFHYKQWVDAGEPKVIGLPIEKQRTPRKRKDIPGQLTLFEGSSHDYD